MDLGRVGIWTSVLDMLPAAQARDGARRIEAMGYASIWFPESARREAMSNAAILLGATESLVVATGIANIYARDPMTMANGQRTLSEAYPGRFLLGLGVSHQGSVEEVRGHVYGKPVATMRGYLDRMAGAPYLSPPPSQEPATVLAALGPNMLRLAAERTAGAHPYFVPVEHTRQARQAMGPKPLLAPEQAVVLEADPTRARSIARLHTRVYLGLPNYANNLRRLGYGEEELNEGGSDRLVDDVVAWGDAALVAARIQAHFEAGADHVCVQVLGEIPAELPLAEWSALAGRLIS